jgi:cytochrome c556
MKTSLRAGLAATSLLAIVTVDAAAQSKEEVVKARQSAMKTMAADTKSISNYVKGAGDKDSAAKLAMEMSATATSLAKLWPAGTSSKDLPGMTKAKPEAFADGAKFTGRFSVLSRDTAKLADTIKTGSTDEVKAAQTALAKANCSACHTTYRESEDN